MSFPVDLPKSKWDNPIMVISADRKTTKFVTAVFIAAAVGWRIGPVEAGQRFFVGPDKPYRTIASALVKMTNGDECVISEGVYRECPDVRQSGVTFRGVGRVIISGCDQAGPLRACRINGHRGLTEAVGARVYDVFCDGVCLKPARYPDKTFPMTSNRDWTETSIGPDGTVTFGGATPDTLAQLTDGFYVGLHGAATHKNGKLSSWYSVTVPIIGVTTSGAIRVDAPHASSGFMGKFGRGPGLGYIIGAKAVLDAPGEWCEDKDGVTLIPPSGGAHTYEWRVRLYGALVSGDRVRFTNIRFKAAAMRVDGNDVSLEGCAFEYIAPFQHNPNDLPQNKTGQSLTSCWGIPDNGTAGVFVKGNRFVAENCRFAKSWWCGMTIRGNRACVENCLFEDMNWMAKRCAGLFSWGCGNTVRYCTFRNLGGAAIEGGNAHWVGQYALTNVWEYNAIEDIGKLIVDQGFFYVNHQSGANPPAGSVWRYNVGKHSCGPERGDWTQTSVGYYVDNSSSGYRIHNNIAIDAKEPIRYNDTQEGDRAGKDVWFYNNTFYACGNLGFGCWNQDGKKARADADVVLVNNLAVPTGSFVVPKWQTELKWTNNVVLPESALKAPVTMDFTPTDVRLTREGIPVLGQAISYIGAVDPEKGIWRYGAEETKLPTP